MREILFRGKTLLGKWIEGDLIQYLGCGKVHIAQNYKSAGGQEVIPETVGQYTGFTDKNGKKIFEGDIVKSNLGSYVIKFLTGSWCCSLIENEYLTLLSSIVLNEIIGNIHDNPELLKGGAE